VYELYGRYNPDAKGYVKGMQREHK